jgi:hypothetical protein
MIGIPFNEFYIVFEVLTAVVMKSTIFWDITPCSALKVNRRLGGTYHLHLQGRRIRSACHLLLQWFLARLIFWTLKMEAICSSYTSVEFQRTIRRYIPKDCILQTRHTFRVLCHAFFKENYWSVSTSQFKFKVAATNVDTVLKPTIHDVYVFL